MCLALLMGFSMLKYILRGQGVFYGKNEWRKGEGGMVLKRWMSAVFALLLFLTMAPGAAAATPSPSPPSEGKAGKATVGTVQLSVVGDDVRGTILPETTVEIQEGDTAFTVLLDTLGPGKVVYTGSGNILYVREIDGLAEFDRGPLSGWMYRVNGQFPNHSAGVHTVKDGDVVEWVYTTDGGEDVGFPSTLSVKEGNNRIGQVSSKPESESSNKAKGKGAEKEQKPGKKSEQNYSSKKEEKKTNGQLKQTVHSLQTASVEETSDQTGEKEGSTEKEADFLRSLQQSVKWLQQSGSKRDWVTLALSRSVGKVPQGYLEQTTQLIKANNGEFRKVTDYERMALGIRSAGGDPRNVAGYNLIENIYNNERMTLQGNNGVIFALLALDSAHYHVPDHARWNRQKLVDWLIEKQNGDGSWALFGSDGDVDITAMTLTALAPYADEKVKQAKRKGFLWLASQQTESGGFRSWGLETSESASQVIIALASNGMDPTSSLFTQPGGNVLENLLTYQSDDGGFVHTQDGTSNIMATEQAVQALTAYRNYVEGKPRLYDFGDIHSNPRDTPSEEENPEGEDPPKDSPSDNEESDPSPNHSEGNRERHSNSLPGMGGGPSEEIWVTDVPSGSSEIVPLPEQIGVITEEEEPPKKETVSTEENSNPRHTEKAFASASPSSMSQNMSKGVSPQQGLIMLLLGVLCAMLGASMYVYEKRRQWQ
ncbi:Prenyltransferase and squalene oxidase repeat-containing protein [Melghirimyces algeriensis]|uniref:Prenyltransferase and squalene oxidase repeat-containing protein n=2 Tax=Melghirimyces algeriensis TaxID=910412 RepID=A0A521FG35_9BACL|nr:Prenyltransferase and squalene oxidase repeat-containing protein [Melghirimyces algeriensis]